MVGLCEDGEHLYEDFWYVGNIRSVRFAFHKTDQRLYSALSSDNPVTWLEANAFLLAGAQFRLFRYYIPNTEIATPPGLGRTMEYLVSHDPTHPTNPYHPWVSVDLTQFVSTGDPSTPIWYNLDPRFTYQLVEVMAPSAPVQFERPWGQWRIAVVERAYDDTLPPGDPQNRYPLNREIEILWVGDSSIPAFAWIPDLGYWFVGNRPVLILPMTGASTGHLFTISGLLLIALALTTGGVALYAKHKKWGPWEDEDEMVANLQDAGT